MGARRAAVCVALFAALSLLPRFARAEPPPIVIAHRGAAHELPENSLAAFRRALELGAWIEADVRSSRDGELIVIHDAGLARTTSGRGLVARHTFLQLRALTLRGALGPGVPAEQLPSLAEVLALDAPGLGVVIDVKELGEPVAERIARAVREQRGVLSVMIGVRDAALARALRDRLPETRQVAFISRPSEIEALASAGTESIRLTREWLLAKPALAARVRASGAALLVNFGAADMRLLPEILRHRPDAILCDDPARVLAALEPSEVDPELRRP